MLATPDMDMDTEGKWSHLDSNENEREVATERDC